MAEQLLAAELLKRLADFEVENSRLQAEVARLQAENAELHRRLGMNSQNSHKPPSSDGYRKKRVQPAMLKGEKRASGVQKTRPARNLLCRLTAYKEAVLAFALVEGVPFTNHQAERDLRPAKIKQKASGCFRTESGAKMYARLQGVISTCRKQGRCLYCLFAHQPVTLLAG